MAISPGARVLGSVSSSEDKIGRWWYITFIMFEITANEEINMYLILNTYAMLAA